MKEGEDVDSDDKKGIYKHQQHLKLQKEIEDESWISGEELRTDGSSDEDKKRRQHKNKLKIRRKSSSDKKSAFIPVLPSTSSDKSAPTPPPLYSSAVTMEVPIIGDRGKTSSTKVGGEEAAASSSMAESLDLENKWRPKRVNDKMEAMRASARRSHIDYQKEIRALDLFEEIVQKLDSLKFKKPVTLFATGDHGDCEIPDDNPTRSALSSKIESLDKLIQEHSDLLEGEKRERLRIQQEVCDQIRRDERCYDRGASHFLNLCHFEETSSADLPSDDEDDDSVNNHSCAPGNPNPSLGDPTKRTNRAPRGTGKDYVRRNVELAAKAMTNLPLTDEEKQKLDQLLSEIEGHENPDVPEKESRHSIGLEETSDSNNAFHMPEGDLERISQIDVSLKDFDDGDKNDEDDASGDDSKEKSGREDNSWDQASVNTFWRNLALEQRLKEINSKLASLEKADNMRPRDPNPTQDNKSMDETDANE